MDYGPQTPTNTTTVATAVQRRWACHTRTVLPTDAYGRQRCNVVLSACSVVYLWYMSCGLSARERATKTDIFYRYVRTVQNRPHTEEPRKSSYPLPAEKNFEIPPRDLQCSDRAQTSTTGSGQPYCVDVVLGFRLKVLVRRDKFENRRKLTNIRIHTRLPFGEWDVSRGVTQAGMPQGKIINRHPAVPLVA